MVLALGRVSPPRVWAGAGRFGGEKPYTDTAAKRGQPFFAGRSTDIITSKWLKTAANTLIFMILVAWIQKIMMFDYGCWWKIVR